jgi:hypothetical protein
MKDVTETAIIVGVFFWVGVIFGVLLVVALAAIRTQQNPQPPADEGPELDSDAGSSRWPDLTP